MEGSYEPKSTDQAKFLKGKSPRDKDIEGLVVRISQRVIKVLRKLGYLITYNDPLLELAKDQGVPVFPEVGQSVKNATTWVLEFPQKAPESSMVQSKMSAIEQLEYWKKVKLSFTEHNPSVTIYVKDGEWVSVSDWVYRNWEIVGGLSFLPASDHVYQLAPYEKISQEEYDKRLSALSSLDLSLLSEYEKVDNTQPQAELACTGRACEL